MAADDVQAERDRFNRALGRLSDQLERERQEILTSAAAATASDVAAALLQAHQAVLRDPLFADAVRAHITEHRETSEQAIAEVLATLEARFGAIEAPAMRGWWRDLVGLVDELRRVLAGEPTAPAELAADTVVVAHGLTVSQTTRLLRDGVRGIVLARGSTTSHVAVLCRAAGVPLVLGVAVQTRWLAEGVAVLVDGDRGLVSRTNSRPAALGPTHAAPRAERSRGVVKTRDGHVITLRANLDAVLATDPRGSDTRGVGLLRVRSQFLGRATLPTADELAVSWRRTLRAAGPERVAIRLLDPGGAVPADELPEALRGHRDSRGVRLLRSCPAALDVQLEALCRIASEGALGVTVPFVSAADEVRFVRDALRAKGEALGVDVSAVAVGTMIELPAALYRLDALAAVSDYFSIGSNDLFQFLFAAPREGLDPWRPEAPDDVLAAAISAVCAAAERAGIEVWLCGELAVDEERLPTLLSAGLRTLSVSPAMAPRVRAAIEGLTLSG